MYCPFLLLISSYIGAIMQSLQRQREIYLQGLAGEIPLTPFSFSGLETNAGNTLIESVYTYLSVGTGSETIIHSNRQAFDQVKFHPQMPGGVQEVCMQLKWRERTLPAPFILTPSVLELSHRDVNLAVTKGVSKMGIPTTISNQASYPIILIS